MSISQAHIDGFVEPVIEEVTRTLRWKDRELHIGVSAAHIENLLADRIAKMPLEARKPVVERLHLYGEYLAVEQRAYGASQTFLSSLRRVSDVPKPINNPPKVEGNGKGTWTFKTGRGRSRTAFGRTINKGFRSW